MQYNVFAGGLAQTRPCPPQILFQLLIKVVFAFNDFSLSFLIIDKPQVSRRNSAPVHFSKCVQLTIITLYIINYLCVR